MPREGLPKDDFRSFGMSIFIGTATQKGNRMAHFEDIGFEETFRITLTFDQDEYDMIEYVCKKKRMTKKEYFNRMILECILYMKDEEFK